MTKVDRTNHIPLGCYVSIERSGMEFILIEGEDPDAWQVGATHDGRGDWWDWDGGRVGLHTCKPHPDPDDLWARYIAAKLRGEVRDIRTHDKHEQDPANFT